MVQKKPRKEYKYCTAKVIFHDTPALNPNDKTAPSVQITYGSDPIQFEKRLRQVVEQMYHKVVGEKDIIS